jgi:hypothetical protein
MKGTHEVSRLTLFPDKDSTIFGENPQDHF